MDAVVSGERGHAEIGHDKPLRGKLAVVVTTGRRALGRRGHDIDARLQWPERLVDRKRSGDVLVQGHGGGDLARPHLHAALIAEAVDLVGAQRFLEVAIDDGVDQVAVADAVDVDIDRRRVDADQRNAFLSGARQHIGLAGEAHERLAVADIDVELGRFRQRLLHGRRQAGAQIDVVAFAVLQPFDAELPVLARQCRLVGAGQRHERSEIGALGEVLGELEAGARARRVGIDGVIEQPEAVLVAQPFILAAHIRHLAQVERHAQRIQRRPPQLALRQRPPEHGQRLGLLAGIAGALIGDIGRGGGAFQQGGPLGWIDQRLESGRAGRQLEEDGAGQPQPVGGILRRGRRDLPQYLQGGGEVASPERGVGIVAQGGDRLCHRSGLGLDLGFELDGGIGQIVPPERLVGRLGRGETKHERGREDGGTNQTDHEKLPGGADERPRRCRFGQSWARNGDLCVAAHAKIAICPI